jgi:hypothetical protein
MVIAVCRVALAHAIPDQDKRSRFPCGHKAPALPNEGNDDLSTAQATLALHP